MCVGFLCPTNHRYIKIALDNYSLFNIYTRPADLLMVNAVHNMTLQLNNIYIQLHNAIKYLHTQRRK